MQFNGFMLSLFTAWLSNLPGVITGFLGTFLLSIGWLMNLLGIFGSILPLAAFAITTQWDKDFDCFGILTLMIDLVMAFMKAWMYMFLGGLTDKTCTMIIEAVVCNCMSGCLIGCSVYSFLCYKTHHGLLPQIVRTSIVLVVLFLVGSGMVMFGLQMKWYLGEFTPKIMMLTVMSAQVFETAYPILMRCCCSTFSHDESAVVAWKSLASVILILTSLYDGWSLGASLQVIATPLLAKWHLAMCLTAAIAGAVQLVIRLFSFTDRLLQGMQLTCCSRVWHFIKAVGDCLTQNFVVVTEFWVACVASIYSGLGTVLEKVKAVFGGAAPAIP